MPDEPRQHDETTAAGFFSDPEFEELIEACLRRFEAEGTQAVDEICAANPGRAEQLRGALGRLLEGGLLRRSGGGGDDAFPEELGEFRLIERIGVGGMGVVFRARQQHLQREVALKLIRPEYLFFPGARDRLRREVEAVGRLDHPGIVSIYTVGEEGEMPYFAMEYVHGTTVEVALRGLRSCDPKTLTGRDLHGEVVARTDGIEPTHGLPGLYQGTWPQVCARIARQVAEALEHAHGRGIVHRDIKPSNIMITPGGRVLVVDFGLARLQAEPRMTRSGSVLGSLAYMAPEQVRGEHTDERVDVYGLGVTLFELLTLQLPHAGASPTEVQRSILTGDFSTPRGVNPSIPRDLETVCLNAMQREPSRRYDSARDLADDLTNVLELRPVAARRPGAILRVVRWTQRHRAATVAIVLGIALAVGLPLSLWWQQRGANREIRAASDQVREANEQIRAANLALVGERDNAERQFERALDTVDRLLTRVAERRLRDVPEIAAVRAALMRDALQSYEAFLGERPDDDDLRERVARAATTVARELALSGQADEAHEHFTRALALWEQLFEANPDIGPELWSTLIEATESGANPLLDPRPEPATRILARVREADARIQEMTARHLDRAPAVQRPRIELLRLISRRTPLKLAMQVGELRPEDFEARMLELESAMERLLETAGADLVTAAIGRCVMLRAERLEGAKDNEQASATYAQAVQWFRRTPEEGRRRFRHRQDLLRSLNGQARCLGRLGRNQEAVAIAQAATDHADDSLRYYPDYIELQFERGLACQQLALSRFNLRETPAALDAIHGAVSSHREVYRKNPEHKASKQLLWEDLLFRGVIASAMMSHNLMRNDSEEMRELLQDPKSLVKAASLRVAAAQLVRKDHTLSAEGRERSADNDEIAAVSMLEAAVQGGLKDAALLHHAAFEPIRARDRFKTLVEHLGKAK